MITETNCRKGCTQLSKASIMLNNDEYSLIIDKIASRNPTFRKCIEFGTSTVTQGHTRLKLVSVVSTKCDCHT